MIHKAYWMLMAVSCFRSPFSAPYIRSPTRGHPMADMCTRIWWVRPVVVFTRSSEKQDLKSLKIYKRAL